MHSFFDSYMSSSDLFLSVREYFYRLRASAIVSVVVLYGWKASRVEKMRCVSKYACLLEML